MGINDLLGHLPGGGQNEYHHSFYDLKLGGKEVPIDAASALWQFAANHAWDHLHGNHLPALKEWAHFLLYLRAVCGWKLSVYMDGMENVHKQPEIERRKRSAATAKESGNLLGQIKNTPEYIAEATHICEFLGINVYIAAYEADPQVSYASVSKSAVPVSGDSDLLAYGVSGEKGDTKLIIVKGFKHEWFRVIDLNADVPPGDYPLFDLYRKHGRIVFQLYAGCSGCDFTFSRSGISGVGYESFVACAGEVEGELTAETLSTKLWEHEEDKIKKAGFETCEGVPCHLQRIVDVYQHGHVYDKDSNIVDMSSGEIIQVATEKSRRHMAGKINSRTQGEFSGALREQLDSMKCDQMIHQSAADLSNIRGVTLPTGKQPHQCTVSDLRDFVAARGGKISLTKPDLIAVVKRYQFMEEEVEKTYVDRNPKPNGLLFAKINTSGTRSIKAILDDLKASCDDSDGNTRDLIWETHNLFTDGYFEDKYDNIARVAPELPESFIYKQFCNIGASITEKNIGDALRRCWYDKDTTYHAIAFVPDTNRVIILSKAHASMRTDEQTRHQTDDGEPPKKKEYLLIMELIYKPTNDIENSHGLGVFVEMGRTYCAGCVAGKGKCRHLTERLWYQYHHWTHDRFGIERPRTLDVCSWAPGGKALVCDVRKKIYEQQAVKYERSIKAQVEKSKRGAKRNCTEGISCDYQVHLSTKKQCNQPGRFTKERCEKLFRLLRENK